MNIFPLRTGHYRIIALLWTLSVVAACVIPVSTLPGTNSYIGLDKAGHFLLFFGIAVLWLRALRPDDALFDLEDDDEDSNRRLTNLRARTFWIFMLGTAFALVTEVLQHVLPLGRLFEGYDLAADMAGLMAGIVIYYQQRIRSWRLDEQEPDDIDARDEGEAVAEGEAEGEETGREWTREPRYHADVQNALQEDALPGEADVDEAAAEDEELKDAELANTEAEDIDPSGAARIVTKKEARSGRRPSGEEEAEMVRTDA